MNDVRKTRKTQVRRMSQRGHYDRKTVYDILDAGLVCHVGIVVDGGPVVIPTAYWRDRDAVYFHGSAKSHMLKVTQAATDICLAVSLIDGLVMARSGFHHSINYRSVVLFGRAESVTGDDERLAAMRAFMERLAPGRWDELRPPSRQELRATQIRRLPIDEAAAKIRSGPPIDDGEDMAADVWARMVPVVQTFGDPLPDPQLKPGIAAPGNLPSGAIS